MPEAAVAAPPASAPAAPAPKPEIKVSTMTPSTQPATPAKPGSAKERMYAEVNKFAASKETPPAAAPAAEPESPPAASEPQASEPKPGETTPPVADPKDKKKNPWKMLDEERANTRKLQEQIAEANKRAIPETEWKSHQEKMSSVEKRNRELEDEIRYVNYQKSEEFQKKYQEPYTQAWKRALSELGELQVDDGSGNARQFKASDLMELVTMPLQKARERAESLYGNFANDVMQHRKEVRRLYDEQSAALDEVRKSGETRQKEMTEKAQREQGEVVNLVRDTWNSENESALKNEKYGKYFTPREGDQEGNLKLAKGYELADRAFIESPFDKGLTAEQRKARVARHAVVRNRCAAFGRLTHDLEKSSARIAELEKELSQFKGSEPGVVAAGSRPSGGSATPGKNGTALSRMQAELAKRAKPN